MRVLFGVFDWGLGHATRSSPLIEGLLKKKHKVDILSTGRALIFLKNKFGRKCKYFDVPSIFVPYPKHRFFVFSFVKNIPKMIFSLKKARKITEKIIKKGKYDKIISDCRYDVYGEEDKSYLINHQLRFIALPIVQYSSEKWLASRMKYYKYIIVPDFDKNNLSGNLSHKIRFVEKNKIKYIGILSHIKKRKITEDVDYFISISGPEPQRTVLEEKIMPDLKLLKGKIVVALGKPESRYFTNHKHITICGFLDSKKQAEMMNRAKFIISRSGYTTIMEIAELGKNKTLFIPTPGQTEQEYLADLYEKRKQFNHVHQNKLNLIKNIEECRKFNG